MGTLAWKLLSTVSPMAAGLVAGKGVDALWRSIGNEKVDPKDPDADGRYAVAYAALTGLAVAAAQTWAIRRAARYYEESAGHLPKALTKG